MLYLNIITWEPPQREGILKRFATRGVKPIAGMKTLGMWGDVCGGRVFQLVETGDVHDPTVYVQANHEWTDLCKIESIGLMNLEDIVKVMASKK